MSCLEVNNFVTVKLTVCNDLSCCRSDHYICPCTICYMLLHPNKLSRTQINYDFESKDSKTCNDDTSVIDEKPSNIILDKCKSRSFCNREHIRCPVCGTSLHFKIYF